ncbi:sensor histidine kinase [Nonomuraea sp. CA-141351]|uniref:sensor histidine kinase n=1 Tax=Nonomuraea sp. CA-141351 TaxID=3239996 RepID=UPI003D94C859
MRAPSGIVPTALRLGTIVLLVVAQMRATPAPGLTGTSLAITLVTVALALALLTVLLLSIRRPVNRETRRPADPLTTPRRQLSLPPRIQARFRSLPLWKAPQPHRPTSRPEADLASQASPKAPEPTDRPSAEARQPGNQPSRKAQHAGDQSPSESRRPLLVFGVPVTLIALGLAVILSIVLSALTQGGPAIAALLICVSLAVTRFSLRQALPIGVLAIGGLIVAGEIAGRPSQDLPLILSNCLIFLISYAAKQRKATRAAEAREAVLAERARIAREIHDILAHSLSAQLVHLEGAKLLLRAERTAEALERVTHARDLAKSGLEEARRAVAALREDSPALPVALRMLAQEFESTTHQACTLRISGPEHRLSPATELALVRTAQEALTNVRRHAPGSPATVELELGRPWCELRVTNPASTEKGSPGGGYGLVGMRERAELLGGTLSAGEHDGGFLVHLKVPS